MFASAVGSFQVALFRGYTAGRKVAPCEVFHPSGLGDAAHYSSMELVVQLGIEPSGVAYETTD